MIFTTSFLPKLSLHVTNMEYGEEEVVAIIYQKYQLQNENDNALYCGGFGVQHHHNGGRGGICGDPWDAFPR